MLTFAISASAQSPRNINEFSKIPDGSGISIWQEDSSGKKLNGKYRIVEDSRTYYIMEFKNGIQTGIEEGYKYNKLARKRGYKDGRPFGLSEEYGVDGEGKVCVAQS